MPGLVALLPVLTELVKYAPGLVVEIIGLFHSTNGNPTAADWQALAAKVQSTPFDAPPSTPGQ